MSAAPQKYTVFPCHDTSLSRRFHCHALWIFLTMHPVVRLDLVIVRWTAEVVRNGCIPECGYVTIRGEWRCVGDERVGKGIYNGE